MQELITIVENEPRVSHRVVAEQTENQQKNVNELIKKYHDDFSEFGTLPFKTEGVINNGKGEQPKTYYLNEPQATFLMTLLRNKPVVVEFKKKLVKAFYKQREELQTPSTSSDTNAVMIEMMKNQQRLTDAVLDVINTQQSQNKVIMEYVTATFDGLKNIGQVKVDEKAIMPQYLDSRDRKKLRDAIKEKAKEVARDLGVSVSTISPAIWIELKDFFDVDDYQDIHKNQMKDVMHYVMFWEPKSGSAMKSSDPKIEMVLL